MYDVIIPSAGHSGSKYAALLLTRNGIPCGHEKGYHLKNVNPPRYAAESSVFCVRRLNDEYCAGARCIHLVRDPYRVVRSWALTSQPGKKKPCCHRFSIIDGVYPKGTPPWTEEWQLAQFWIDHNARIRALRPDSVVCQVEDWKGLLEAAGAPEPWEDVSHATNTHANPAAHWEPDEKTARIIRTAQQEYGYAAEPPFASLVGL